MADLPVFPVWIDALIGDTAHMSPAEFGAYFRILCAMWRHKGYLPRSEGDEQLRRIAGMDTRAWRRSRDIITEPLTAVVNDFGQHRWTQNRLLETRGTDAQFSDSQSRKARLRWLKTKGPPYAAASRRHMPDGDTGTSRGTAGAYAHDIPSRVQRDDDDDSCARARAERVPDEIDRDGDLERIRRAAKVPQGRAPPNWTDAELAPVVERWRRDLGLSTDEIAAVAAAVCDRAPGRISSPRYLTSEMTKAAERKQSGAPTLKPTKEQPHGRRSRRETDDERRERLAREDRTLDTAADELAERLERQLAGGARGRG